MESHCLRALEHRLRVIEDKPANDECCAGEVQSMLSDGEALEGVEAWLSRQPLMIALGPRNAGRAAAIYVESPAGWLLRLVRHARMALVG
ncbi:hypothetical protein L602_001000000870 [Cupriavidus gilardii J11]|uniref:Uncharacterized protein n=1 Tax=Cupriavidus gilardii J11 TaxID=936133 RepID=A0A562BUF8_9BURK|nr:hypothetical protein L602_001000000870 [Cupriavidus gilardii J11]